MQKNTIIPLALILGLSLFLIDWAPAKERGPVFNLKAWPERTRPVAAFDHDRHNEFKSIKDCGACHHVYQDGKPVAGKSSEDQSCAECHQPRPRDASTRLALAYHRLCQQCHDREKKGPVACGECHARL